MTAAPEGFEREPHLPKALANGATPADGPPEGFFDDGPPEAPVAPLVQFIDHDDLFAPEPKANLLVSDLGIAPGPPTGFFGQSYVGKTIVQMSGGMAVALGRDFWGLYRVRGGLWVHFDYEQGRRRSKTLVQRLAAGFGVTKEDLRGKLRVTVYPPLNLTSAGAVDHYAHAFDGAAVVTLDALKGLTPGVDENSSQMRDHMAVLRLASEKTGATVLLNHNSGKTPADGKRPRKEAGRGSSAIFDECAAGFVMTADKGDPALVSHEKDRELGLLVADFGLRIEDVVTDDGNPKGGLRVVHLDREQVKPIAPAKPEGVAKFDAIKKGILDVVRATPTLCSGNDIAARVTGTRGLVLQAIRELLRDGQLVQSEGEGGAFRVSR